MWRYLLNKPLTLQELRGMCGEPVWVHIIDASNIADPKDAFDGWGFCRTSWVRIWDASRADLIITILKTTGKSGLLTGVRR